MTPYDQYDPEPEPVDDDPMQAAFEVMSATYTVQRCAAQARLSSQATTSTWLVGVAPGSLRGQLEKELAHNIAAGDVEAWLTGQAITLVWVADGADGASADYADTLTADLSPVTEVRLWAMAD